MGSSKEKNRRILILDDDADILGVLKIRLELRNWEVTAVSTVADAFNALAAAPHFLVITDIAMPEMDGYEFLSAVKERGYQCGFAVMTGFGYDRNHIVVKIRKAFKSRCFRKPFENFDAVAKVVDDAFFAYHSDIPPD